MTTRYFLYVAFTMGLAAGCSGAPIEPKERLNLILVTIDTLRADRVSAYGERKGLTPHLDGLASRGVLFLDATAHAPLTVPSHASILTGQFPSRHGVRDNAGFTLSAESTTLAEILRGAGYRTAAFVSSYVLNRATGLSQGFEVYVDAFRTGTLHVTLSQLELRGPEVATKASPWITVAEAPFFLWVHFYDPHAPYEPPPAFAREGEPYDGEVATSDWALGDLLRALPAASAAHTLVVVTGDHGESLGQHGELEHGIFLYDATLKVPLVMAGPGLPRGARVKTQVRHVDIVPTILDLLGIPIPSPIDGESLLPLVARAQKTAPVSYAESAFGQIHFGWSPLRAARNGEWKYIEAPGRELYNLKEDPDEATNVYDARGGAGHALARELERVAGPWREATGVVDSSTAERLRSLGYVGGTRAQAPLPSGERSGEGPPETEPTGDDPKQRIADYVAYVSAFNQAMRDLETDRSAKAARAFRELVRKFPRSFEAHQYLGRSLAASGDLARALDAYKTAMELSPHSAIVYFDAARALAARGELERALEHVEEGLALEPNSFYGHLVDGMTAQQAGLEERAKRSFEKALALNPDLAMAEYQLGAMAEARGAREEALDRYRKAASSDPSFKEARAALTRLSSR